MSKVNSVAEKVGSASPTALLQKLHGFLPFLATVFCLSRLGASMFHDMGGRHGLL